MSKEENNAVKTDLNELVKAEVRREICMHDKDRESFEKKIDERFDRLEDLVLRISPGRVWVIVEKAAVWIGLIVLFLLQKGCA